MRNHLQVLDLDHQVNRCEVTSQCLLSALHHKIVSLLPVQDVVIAETLLMQNHLLHRQRAPKSPEYILIDSIISHRHQLSRLATNDLHLFRRHHPLDLEVIRAKFHLLVQQWHHRALVAHRQVHKPSFQDKEMVVAVDILSIQ